MLQRRPNTFAQTILSLSFFACDKAADHTFLFACNPGIIGRNSKCPRMEHPVRHPSSTVELKRECILLNGNKENPRCP